MTRSRGLKVARKRLASGEIREYFYDRQTGLFLGNDRTAARERLAKMEPDPVRSDRTGTIAALIEDYKRSTHYRAKLAPGTRELYGRYLDLIQNMLGDMPIRSVKPPHIERLKNAFEATPRKANLLIAVMRILFTRAVKRGDIPANPATKPEMIPIDPRDRIWSAAEERAFLEAAGPRLRLAFALMLFTVQRQADVLAMTRGQIHEIEGRLSIDLRQRKTRALVRVPVHNRLEPILRERLAEMDSEPTLLLVASPKGKPWARRNFSRAWDQAVQDAGLSEVQRRDLRRTGMVRMAEAGATTAQIVSVSGHSIDYGQKILDTYLPRRPEVAAAGIAAWESAPETAPRVVRLADAVRRRRQ